MKTNPVRSSFATSRAKQMFFGIMLLVTLTLVSCNKQDKKSEHTVTSAPSVNYPLTPPVVKEVVEEAIYMVASDEVVSGKSVVLLDVVRQGGTGDFMPFLNSTISYVAGEKLTYGDQVKVTKRYEDDVLVSAIIKKVDRPKKK